MTEYLIRVSWPDPKLQSNARGHWRPKAAATKAYRAEAFYMAKQAGVAAMPSANLEFSFYQPNNRKRDLHNMPAAMKAVIDGIADAMGCDDNAFKCRYPDEFSGVTLGGAVVIRIRPPVVDIPHHGTIT